MIKTAQILGRLNGGGVEQVVYNYTSACKCEDISFDFFCFEAPGINPFPTEQVYTLPSFRRPIRYVRTLKAYLKNGGYDIVHCHLSTLSVLPLLAARLAGVPVRILHNHSTSGGKRELARNLVKALLKPLAKLFATDFFACSRLAAQWLYGNKSMCSLSDDFFDRKHIVIMPNAIDTGRFAFSEEKRGEARRELSIPDEAVVIGHIGRLCPQKNQSFLLDIFSEFCKKAPGSFLVLAGAGGDENMLKEKASRILPEGRVVFTGQFSEPDKLYSGFDCFIMPSNYEGLPVVGAEAQCSGLPCIFSDRITGEAAFLPETRFISLGEPPGVWADAALEMVGQRIADSDKRVCEKGYDIRHASQELLGYYRRKISVRRGK